MIDFILRWAPLVLGGLAYTTSQQVLKELQARPKAPAPVKSTPAPTPAPAPPKAETRPPKAPVVAPVAGLGTAALAKP